MNSKRVANIEDNFGCINDTLIMIVNGKLILSFSIR